MTCDDCQALIIEMARGVAIDPASREEARRHAALCAHCGAQQEEQQWLTTQFRAIAAADANLQAPERVEIATLAAWRATYASSAVSSGAAAGSAPATALGPQGPPVLASEPRAAARVLTGRWMLPGVAVGLAAAAMATLFVWPASHRSNVGAVTPSAQTARVTPNTLGTESATPRNTESRGGRETTPAAAAAEDSAAAARTPRLETVLARAKARETDEFLPLPYVEPLRSTEARHVVRVSMTSGDEMILGVLPADRRTGQSFEADVLVGEDGIARAIRVVR
jgi:hypothetical protein